MSHVIYGDPKPDDPLSQGDVIDGCPFLVWEQSYRNDNKRWEPVSLLLRGVVLTQTCDLEWKDMTRVVVAVVHTAQDTVDQGKLKESQIRNGVVRHKVYGWYFLPKGPRLPESVVDLRDLHTLPRAILEQLAREGNRVCSIKTPYREHMAQHFTVTYSRIALEEPYRTKD